MQNAQDNIKVITGGFNITYIQTANMSLKWERTAFMRKLTIAHYN